MKNRKKTKISAAVLLTGLLIFLTACGGQNGKIRFGTADPGGVYYSFGLTFAEYLEADLGMNVDVKNTNGSAANIRLLSEDYIQLGLAQSDMIAELKESDYSEGYSAVAGLYTEACQFVVREDSGIDSIDDLSGLRVNVGEEESGSVWNAMEILAVYGLNEYLVDMHFLDYTEASEALEAGEIDAFFCTAGVQTEVIEELAQKIGIKLLPVGEDEAEAVAKFSDYYTSYTIPAGTYTGQDSDVQTIGVRVVLLARDDLSSDTVRKVTECLFSHAGELEKALPLQIELTAENAVEGIPLRFHKGAAEYYAEKGVAVSTGQ